MSLADMLEEPLPYGTTTHLHELGGGMWYLAEACACGVCSQAWFWAQVAIAVLWQTVWDMGVWGVTPAWADELLEEYIKADEAGV